MKGAPGVALLLALTIASLARLDAHVGSPDVFVDTHAGPYHLLITIRTPRVIPGVAQIDVEALDDDVSAVDLSPMPLTGVAATFAPTPDRAKRASDDAHRYTSQLWMMTAGAWQVHVAVTGARGRAVAGVPVPTLPETTLAMSRGLGTLLLVCLGLLMAGVVAIVSAVAREATLMPGQTAGAIAIRRGRKAAVITGAIVVGLVALGNLWWNAEASRYARYVYKPLEAAPVVDAGGRLTLTLRDPGWIALRRVDDFVEDHGHLMHLFIVSPSLDRFWHLHPRQTGPSTFDEPLPKMSGGRYDLFADVVHATGIAETITGAISTKDVPGFPLTGDDSAWTAATPAASGRQATAVLADGGRMTWINAGDPIHPGQLTRFSFRVEDEAGRPAGDLELYMGMPGHAIFVRRDLQVFAHVHPAGSASMAALEISQLSIDPRLEATASAATEHLAMPGMTTRLGPVVTFPYGIPTPGDYRIFVQVRRRGQVETGAFDVQVK